MNVLKNSVQLIGNLGRNVELRTTNSGSKVASVTMATSDYYKNSKGEKIQETQWHNLTAWNKTAEIMDQILEKGNEIAVRGKLVHRKYEDKEGVTRYVSEIIVSEFMKLSKSKADKEVAPF